MVRLAGAALSSLFFLIILSSFELPLVPPTGNSKGKVEWLSPEEAYELNAKEPRKMLVDLYTDWCGWCKVMDRETYSKAEIAEYINKNYYPIKFNAEQRQSIKIGDRNYHFIQRGRGGIHAWAMVLSQNKPSFPTTVFLDEKMKIIQPIPGYIKPAEFYRIVTFFGGDHYKNEPFEDFVKGTFEQLY
ncbi:MAG: DUF255 domain-containing protein [Spirosomataceae bacterium]